MSHQCFPNAAENTVWVTKFDSQLNDSYESVKTIHKNVIKLAFEIRTTQSVNHSEWQLISQLISSVSYFPVMPRLLWPVPWYYYDILWSTLKYHVNTMLHKYGRHTLYKSKYSLVSIESVFSVNQWYYYQQSIMYPSQYFLLGYFMFWPFIFWICWIVLCTLGYWGPGQHYWSKMGCETIPCWL